MAQPIKYWDTDVPAARTASQLMDLLVKYKAERTMIEWDENAQPTAVMFAIRDAKLGVIPVRIKARVDEVAIAVRKITGRPVDRARAQRIAWRHLKDLVEQQLFGVSLGQMTMAETFFSNMLLAPQTGVETMGEYMQAALATGQMPRAIDGTLMLPPTTRANE